MASIVTTSLLVFLKDLDFTPPLFSTLVLFGDFKLDDDYFSLKFCDRFIWGPDSVFGETLLTFLAGDIEAAAAATVSDASGSIEAGGYSALLMLWLDKFLPLAPCIDFLLFAFVGDSDSCFFAAIETAFFY